MYDEYHRPIRNELQSIQKPNVSKTDHSNTEQYLVLNNPGNKGFKKINNYFTNKTIFTGFVKIT